MLTGLLIDINKINYTGKDGKAGILNLAVLQIGNYEESVVISPEKAEEIVSLKEQEFHINIVHTTMYNKAGDPRQAISFKLGARVQTKAK